MLRVVGLVLVVVALFLAADDAGAHGGAQHRVRYAAVAGHGPELVVIGHRCLLTEDRMVLRWVATVGTGAERVGVYRCVQP
jgi:hypothetical protein